ncbi:MAG: LPXTG cell wall anchor domain-containing protein [Clostridia bacterium]|nr:LPXTG cell wall anchor domain-containing protein [Clostridia bacterium]
MAEGKTGTQYALVCNAYDTDANGKVEIADKTSVVIDKLVEDTSDISSPNTGDVTLVIVALAFVSAVAAGAILSIRKKGNC